MNEIDVSAILARHFKPRHPARHLPTDMEWHEFETRVDCHVSETFRSPMQVAPHFCFEGGLLCVAADDGIYGEDTILSCYSVESGIGGWNGDWLPLYDFGNGDYYVLNKASGKVFCVRHEDRSTSDFRPTLDDWINGLPDY